MCKTCSVYVALTFMDKASELHVRIIQEKKQQQKKKKENEKLFMDLYIWVACVFFSISLYLDLTHIKWEAAVNNRSILSRFVCNTIVCARLIPIK